MKMETEKQLAENFKFFQFLHQATNQKPICDFPPHQMFVEPTNVCNLRCQMCIQDKMERPKGYMDILLMKKIIDDAVPFDPFFDFCRQGEPLLHPDLPEMIEYAVQQGLTKTRLITNGTLLKSKMAERLVKSGLHKLTISFNGYDRESYQRVMKGANFDKTIAKILNLLKLKAQLKSDTPEVEISLVCYDDLKDENNKKRFFSIFKEIPVNRLRFSGQINFFGKNKDEQLQENLKKPFKEWPSCKVPFRFFNVNWNGDVTPCIVDYDLKYIIGNLNKASVLDVWNNKAYQDFRNYHIKKQFDEITKRSNGDFCEKCSQLWFDPKDNGPQYPASLEQGIKDFFDKDEQSNKNMAGRFTNELFRTRSEVNDMLDGFLKAKDQLYEKIIKEA